MVALGNRLYGGRRAARLPAALLAALLVSCITSPEKAKQTLLASGDRYFEQGDYREAAIMYQRAIQYDRRFGEAYFRLAKAELHSGRVAQAAGALHRAVELQPENAQAFSMLCEIYLTAQRHDPAQRDRYLREVEDLVQQAERAGIDAFEIARIRGLLEMARGEPGSAVEHFRLAHRMQPDHGRVLLAFVRALLAAGRLEEAEKLARGEIDRNPSNEDMYDRLYLIYLREGRDEDAERLIEEKCRRNPDSHGCRLQLAAHYHRVGKFGRRDAVLEELESMPGAGFRAAVNVAEFYERISDFEKAIRVYRKAIEEHPDREQWLKLRIAEAMTMAGRGADALGLVEEVLAADPDYPQALALRGALRLFGGDPDSTQEAIADMSAVLAEMPRNPVLRYHLGLAYLAAGDVDKAMVQFQEAIELMPAYEAARYYLGRIYLSRRQPAVAAQLADEILKIHPGSERGKLLRADASIRMGEHNQARVLLTELLSERPENRDAQFLLAALNVAQRRYREAEAALQRLYRIAPQDSRGIRGLVALYLAEGRPEEAQRLLDAELAKHPESRQLRMISAQVAIAANDFERAIAHYNAMLEADPNQAAVQIALGVAYYKIRDLKRAEEHFAEAVRIQPKNVMANLRLSMLYGELGRFDEARRILKTVLQLAPDNPVALNNMAYILSESPSSLDTAMTLAQRARTLAPQNAHIAETLAWIYFKKHQTDEAIKLYSDIVARYPTRARWRYRYAMALLQKGDKPRARQELQAALAHAATQEEERRIKSLLAQAGS